MLHTFFRGFRNLLLPFVMVGLTLSACMSAPEVVISPTQTPPSTLPTAASSEFTTLATFTASPPTAATATQVPSTYKKCSSLRSVDGETLVTVTFENRSGSAVNIYWIDYQGAEQFYFDLLPGQSKPQDTYVTHVWCARDSISNEPLLTVVATQTGQIVTVVGQAVEHPDCTSGWTRLKAGSYAKVSEAQSSPNRVREAPDISANIIHQIYPGGIVRLVEGPICANGLVFWKVENALIPNGVGWTAEGDGTDYYLEPIQQ